MNESSSAELTTLLSTPLADSWWGRFQEGAAAPWQGFQFLNRHRSLWRYAVAPLVANLVITALVLAMLLAVGAWLLSTVHPWFQTEEGDPAAWAWVLAEIVFGVVLLIVCVGAAMLLWKLLTGILCGHFYGKLAKVIEEQLGAAPGELRDLPFRYQVIDTLYDLAALTAVHVVFFVVGLFPLIGAPLAVVGNFSFTWYILGRDYLDFPLALRGMRRREKSQFCRDRLPHTLGLGSVVFVMEFIPILGAVFLTTAAVGAVLLHRRLREEKETTDSTEKHG